MFADALEKYTNVTFAGEPTGSKGNAYGDSRKIILPNSGITVRASIYYWQDWHPMDKRDATMPDIPAPLTFDAYRTNIDPVLEAIERASGAESTMRESEAVEGEPGSSGVDRIAAVEDDSKRAR